MSRRIVAALALAMLMSVVPAFASGVTVSSATLDVYQTCVISGVSAASTAVADAFVNQGSPSNNTGTNSAMQVQSRTGQNRRAYLRFDLALCSPAIPATAVVVDAQLDLFIIQLAAVCREIDVFLVSTTWAEGTITWNNQPVGTTPNDPPQSQRSAFASIGASPCTYATTNSYAAWALTTDVQSWVDGSVTNHGWILRDDTENGGTTFLTRFSASDADNAARAPRLVITYRP